MALRKFTFHEGTAGNPVVLTQRHISGLVAVAQDDNVEKDVVGYGTMQQGEPIRAYQKEVIEAAFPNFHLVNVNASADVFRMALTTGTAPIKEGGSTRLNVTGIDPTLLVWDVKHSVSVTGAVSLSSATVQSRFHFNHATGEISVDNALENATWVDVVTIKAYPSYDTSNYQEVRLTINAIEVADAALTFESGLVGKGTVNPYVVSLFPTTHTKVVTYTASSNGSGTLDTTTQRYIAPNVNEVATIHSEFFVGANKIATKDFELQVTDPMAKVVIVDEMDSPINDDELTVTIKNSLGVVVGDKLKNGEQCDVNIGETYTVELGRPNGNASYERPTFDSTFVPDGLINEVRVVYNTKLYGIVIVYADASKFTYNQWVSMGKPKQHPISGSAFAAMGYIGDTPDECWCTRLESVSNKIINDTGAPSEDENGNLINVITDTPLTINAKETRRQSIAWKLFAERVSSESITRDAANMSISINGVDNNIGWICSMRIYMIIQENLQIFNDIFKTFFYSSFAFTRFQAYWTPHKRDAGWNCWALQIDNSLVGSATAMSQDKSYPCLVCYNLF